MNNSQRMSLVNSIYNLIFGGKTLNNGQWTQVPKPAGFENVVVSWNPRAFAGGKLRGVDADINDNGKILSIRFMEQNPDKRDNFGNLKQTAIRARNGERIMWVIDKKVANGFLGSIQNGQWMPSQMRAYSQAQSQQAMAAGASSVNNIPDISNNLSNPQYVVQSLEEDPADDFDPGMYDDEYVEDIDYDIPY